MNYYRIKYTCKDGYSNTMYIKAQNNLAAYMACQEISYSMGEDLVSIECYLEDEEND